MLRQIVLEPPIPRGKISLFQVTFVRTKPREKSYSFFSQTWNFVPAVTSEIQVKLFKVCTVHIAVERKKSFFSNRSVYTVVYTGLNVLNCQ